MEKLKELEKQLLKESEILEQLEKEITPKAKEIKKNMNANYNVGDEVDLEDVLGEDDCQFTVIKKSKTGMLTLDHNKIKNKRITIPYDIDIQKPLILQVNKVMGILLECSRIEGQLKSFEKSQD